MASSQSNTNTNSNAWSLLEQRYDSQPDFFDADEEMAMEKEYLLDHSPGKYLMLYGEDGKSGVLGGSEAFTQKCDSPGSRKKNLCDAAYILETCLHVQPKHDLSVGMMATGNGKKSRASRQSPPSSANIKMNSLSSGKKPAPSPCIDTMLSEKNKMLESLEKQVQAQINSNP